MTGASAVLVTGGSRGIGRAIVLEFARRGVDVALTYQSSEDAARQVVDAASDFGGRVISIRHDLLNDDAEPLVGAALDGLGRLTGAVLNAGVWDGGRIQSFDSEAWWRVVETNLRGTYRISRALVPHLSQQPGGALVLMSSAVALSGFPGDTAYASAKSALTGFARSLAHELGPKGMRVNVLAPGFVETDMTAKISDQARTRINQRAVLGRFGSAEEIARAAAFLCEDATFTTGAVLTADGGWTL